MKKRLGKKSRFPLEINEITNEGGRFATAFVRHFFKYGAAQLIRSKSHANLPPASFRLFPSWNEIVIHAKKPDQICD